MVDKHIGLHFLILFRNFPGEKYYIGLESDTNDEGRWKWTLDDTELTYHDSDWCRDSDFTTAGYIYVQYTNSANRDCWKAKDGTVDQLSICQIGEYTSSVRKHKYSLYYYLTNLERCSPGPRLGKLLCVQGSANSDMFGGLQRVNSNPKSWLSNLHWLEIGENVRVVGILVRIEEIGRYL